MKESRKRVSTGSPYEPRFGISRAIRAGQVIAVTGTAPPDAEGRTVAVGDPAGQARRRLEIIATAPDELGGGLEHVVRTRTHLIRIEDWQAVGDVNSEFFDDVCPANTAMQVAGFIDPEWLAEFEADAVVDG